MCDCTDLCTAADAEAGTVASIKADCPVFGAENADLSLCKAAAPMLMAAGEISVGNVADFTSAINTVENDGTIKLTAALIFTADVTIPAENTKSFTIDLNSQTITTGEFSLIHSGTGTVTIKGGTMTGTENVINNSGKLDLINTTVSTTGSDFFAIKSTGVINLTSSNIQSQSFGIENSGTLTIKTGGTTTIKAIVGTAPTWDEGLVGEGGNNYDDTNLGNIVSSGFESYKYPKFSSVSTVPVNDETAFRAAIKAAKEGDRIKLMSSFALTAAGGDAETTNNATNFKIDLNGNTLTTIRQASLSHKGSGTLTITDSTTGAAGVITSTERGATTIKNNGGTLAVVNGRISASDIAIENNDTVTVSGGTVTGNTAINNNINGAVNISKGNITASGVSSRAIFNTASNAVNISGGNITATDIAIYNGYNSTVNISGGSITSTNTAIYNNSSTVNIKSGNSIIKGKNIAISGSAKINLADGVTGLASVNYNGTATETYAPSKLASYKYLKFSPKSTDNTDGSGNTEGFSPAQAPP